MAPLLTCEPRLNAEYSARTYVERLSGSAEVVTFFGCDDSPEKWLANAEDHHNQF